MVDSVAVGAVLRIAHHLVELADPQRATLTAGEHLRLKKEPTVDVDHHLRGTLQVDVEQRETLVALQAGESSSTTSVSQKMLAVSARAIGRLRCIGVRCASWVL